jgi:hypothetical protein
MQGSRILRGSIARCDLPPNQTIVSVALNEGRCRSDGAHQRRPATSASERRPSAGAGERPGTVRGVPVPRQERLWTNSVRRTTSADISQPRDRAQHDVTQHLSGVDRRRCRVVRGVHFEAAGPPPGRSHAAGSTAPRRVSVDAPSPRANRQPARTPRPRGADYVERERAAHIVLQGRRSSPAQRCRGRSEILAVRLVVFRSGAPRSTTECSAPAVVAVAASSAFAVHIGRGGKSWLPEP